MFYIKDQVLCKEKQFDFFFPNLEALRLFSHPVALGKTSNIELNTTAQWGCPCLMPVLRGKTCSFSSFSVMLAVVLPYMSFVVLKHVPCMPNLLEF